METLATNALSNPVIAQKVHINYMNSSGLQVYKDHYRFSRYVTRQRWASYWHQIEAAMESGSRNALCIGIGDDIVPTILASQGLDISRFDLDAGLGADYVGDIRKIDSLVPPLSHDVVICCQVLEHIPFDAFESTLASLLGIARRRVVISLPYRHKRLFDIRLKIPIFPEFMSAIYVPKFWSKWKFNGEHYWEVGTSGYSKRMISGIVSRHAMTSQRFHARGNRYHLFFVIDKISTNNESTSSR